MQNTVLLAIAGASSTISVFLLKKLWKWRTWDKAQRNGNSIPITDVDINIRDLQQIGVLLATAYVMLKKGPFRVSRPEEIPSCFSQFSPIFLLRQQSARFPQQIYRPLCWIPPFPFQTPLSSGETADSQDRGLEQSPHWRIRTSDCSALKPVHVQSQNT